MYEVQIKLNWVSWLHKLAAFCFSSVANNSMDYRLLWTVKLIYVAQSSVVMSKYWIWEWNEIENPKWEWEPEHIQFTAEEEQEN